MRPLAVYADGPDAPLADPASLGPVRRLGESDVVLGWTLRRPPWIADLARPATTLMAGYGLRQAVADGSARAVPTRLSTVPALLASSLRPAVAVVGGRPHGSGFRFVTSVGWAAAAARNAGQVVVEEWPDAPDIDTPAIPGTIVEVIARVDPPDPAPLPRLGDAERRIGELVAGLLPEGATIQWGPGVISAAVVGAISTPVRVLTGLVTDELVRLSAGGLLRGQAEATYLWGGSALRELAASGGVRLRPVEETHDPRRLAATPRFVAINTAVEVGLDGAVNVEKAGGRVVAGPGGHADYCEAASRSEGGVSIVALRASYGGRSSIVARPEVVTTARTDVGLVVTEHGVADLRGADEATRAQRLVEVAAPEHRDALAEAARRLRRG